MNILTAASRHGTINPPPAGGGGGGFDMLAAAPRLWLDGNDEATLLDAETGGSPVTNNFTRIKRWEDKSGNGYHFTDSTGPQRQLTSIQGVKTSTTAVRFSGVHLFNADITVPMGNFTVALVFKNTDGVDYAGPLSIGASGSGDDYGYEGRARIGCLTKGWDGGGGFFAHAGNQGNHQPLVGWLTRASAFVMTFDRIAEVKRMWQDGVEKASLTGSYYAPPVGDSFAGMILARLYLSGAIDLTNYAFGGYIMELAIFPRVLDDTEVAGLSDYLVDKWIEPAPALPDLTGRRMLFTTHRGDRIPWKMYQNTAKTLLATKEGDNVRAWESVDGTTVYQEPPTTAATLYYDGQGVPAIKGGYNRYLQLDGISWGITEATATWIYEPDGAYNYTSWDAGGTTDSWHKYGPTDKAYPGMFRTARIEEFYSVGVVPEGVMQVVSSASEYTIYRDGTMLATTSGSPNFTDGRLTILWDNVSSFSDKFATGWIKALIISDSADSGTLAADAALAEILKSPPI